MSRYRQQSFGRYDEFTLRDPVGYEFENDCIHAMNQSLQKIDPKTKKIQTPVQKANAHADKAEGTDAFIGQGRSQIRVDFTLNFDNKQHMPFIKETDIPALGTGENLKMGIRIGNAHYNSNTNENYSEFNEPVIVIGVTCDPYDYVHNYSNILEENVRKNAKKIIEEAMNCYVEYTETEDRDCIDKTLIPNNAFHSNAPEHICEKYQRQNQTIMAEYTNRMGSESDKSSDLALPV